MVVIINHMGHHFEISSTHCSFIVEPEKGGGGRGVEGRGTTVNLGHLKTSEILTFCKVQTWKRPPYLLEKL